MTKKMALSPEPVHLSSLLDAQPGLTQSLVQYCLALAVVEAGKAKLVSVTPGDTGPVCTFETVTGQRVNLAKPPLSDEQVTVVKQMFLWILAEKG